MIVRFWGTRGSLPSPLKPAEVEEKIFQAIYGMPDIDTDDPEAVRAYLKRLPPLQRGTAGGNTPCVEIQTGGEILIVDAGSGLRELGWELMKGPCGRGEGKIHLIISHPHWDHIHGFPMFQPAFVPGNQILIYGVHDLATALEEQQRELFWPISLSYMDAQKTFLPLQPGQTFYIGKVRISVIQSSHPGQSYNYRFEDQHSVLVYGSDAEYQNLEEASLQPYIEFFRNADALIFDAQYTLPEAWQKEDWGHSSALIGVDMARAAGVKKLLLFHHDPTYSDAVLEEIKARAIAYQAQDPTRPICEILVAYEGLTLDLTPLGAVDLQVTPDGEAAIVTPLHTFDEYGVGQLARQLARLSDQNTSPIIDLSQVATLTTAGLKSLVALRHKRHGAPIVLAAPSENVCHIIHLSGYQDYFSIYSSVEAALNAVHVRESLNLPGQMVKSRYQIEYRIGQGSLGTVLKATDTHTNQPVALKILSSAFGQNTIDRMMQQAQQILALDHPNIVRVFAWHPDGTKVEEFVDGQPLQSLVDPGSPALTIEQAMEIALDIARALEYAHSHGVIHGDLKPENVFLTPEGVKLSGFGLGLLEQGRNLLDAPLLLLSVPYLAPEQILGQALDARTDLYALGVLLYQLLTDRLPFEGTDQEIMQAHLQQSPPKPRELNPHISLSLEHLTLKLLAKNPNERYASAQQTRRISSSLLVHSDEGIALGQSPLVGRQKELQLLQARWEQAQAGRGQLAFISGEMGIGKTRLAQQVAIESETSVRLIGHCQEREGSPAYYLFSQVLRSYFATVPPEFFDDTARQLCANFTHLVPEIRQMLPELQEPPSLEPEHEQLRLMGCLTQFIKRATRKRPWLLVLDDLQWVDSNSLELLRYLGRHLPSISLMIIGIYRDTELGRGHALLEALRDLGRHPTYCHIPLNRLNETQVSELLSGIWQQPVPPALTHLIYLHTEGNPFYVEEVARGLEDEGLIRLQQGRWSFPSMEEVRLPQSVREAVWGRIGHLSPDVQTLLNQAAVLGSTFHFDDLREMSGLSERQLLEHLDTALERQLVHEVPGEILLRFHHPAIQQVLYKDLGPLRRRMLHRLAGESLERRATPQPEHIAEELAHHFAEAGEIERALTYSYQAAEQAQAVYANETALLWYNRTLAMLERLSPEERAPFQSLQLAARCSLGEVLTLVGRYDEALAQYNAAWTLLTPETNPAQIVQQTADLCHQMAQVYERRSEYDQALQWLDKGLASLDRAQPSPQMARLYNLSGYVRMRRGDYGLAQAQLEHALVLAQESGLRQIAANSLRTLGSTLWYLGDYAQAQALYEQALPIYREIGDRQGEGATLNNLGIVASNLGDDAGARAYYEQALSFYREIGDRQGEGRALGNLGVTSDLLGAYAEAHTYYEQALNICREIGDRQGEGNTLINLGIVSQTLGNYATAQRYSEQALQICQEMGHPLGEALANLNLGTILHSIGKYAQARPHYERALRILKEIGYRRGESETLAYLGLLSEDIGEYESSRVYCQQALRIAQEIDDRRSMGNALTPLGHALLGLGRLEEATAAYQQALEIWHGLNRDNLAMEPLAGLARVNLAANDLPRAQSQAEEILGYLQNDDLAGTAQPFRVYLTCYQVLQANQDPRAGDLLDTCHHLLQERAARLEDNTLHHLFLNEVAAHREIQEAFRTHPRNHRQGA